MRAGTTWLSQLLRSHPDCAMTAFKEIHFFDIRYGQFDSCKHYRSKAQRLEKLAEIVAKRVESAVAKGFDAASSSGESGAEHELSPEGRPVARTNEFRAKFSKLANIDDSLREISDILDYLLLLDNESYVRYMTRYSVGARAFGRSVRIMVCFLPPPLRRLTRFSLLPATFSSCATLSIGCGRMSASRLARLKGVTEGKGT